MVLTGCADNPKQEVVVSKNDGSFDANAIQSATATNGAETQQIQYSDNFASTDGTVSFSMNIAKDISTVYFPIVEVSPHYLTAEDAKRIAFSLFPDATFYEVEPRRERRLCKEEIQEMLNRWSQYANESALFELYGEVPRTGQIDNIKSFIEEYTELYTHAPVDIQHQPCQWVMKKTSYYMLPENEYAAADTSRDNDEISAQFDVNGIPYYFTVATRNMNDFKVNMISCTIDSGLSPSNLDRRIFTANLCRTEKPTDNEMAAVKSQAADMLEQMELGDWMIDKCELQTTYYGNVPEYSIVIQVK